LKPLRKPSAFSLAELMIAAAVGTLAMAAAFSGAVTIQRTLVASEEFAADKSEQTRLSDYLALDLRRAISVTGPDANVLLTIKMPDYYDDAGNPITPKVTKTPEYTYVSGYGATPVTVVYRKYKTTITRTEDDGPPLIIATNVEDFDCDLGGVGLDNFVHTRVSFLPSFAKGTASAATRAATTVHNTVRLRNHP
jgi:hypothetical protein